MNENAKWDVVGIVPRKLRNIVTRIQKPGHPILHLEEMVWAQEVDSWFQYPRDRQECQIYSLHNTTYGDLFMCQFNGRFTQENGSPLHIVFSSEPGAFSEDVCVPRIAEIASGTPMKIAFYMTLTRRLHSHKIGQAA